MIVNADGPGEGFNDPTPATPVGGNPGTTLGQQRLNAFQKAASVWGASLTSATPITILANFDPLTCTATSAVLGSAGPRFIFSDFPGAPVAGTWYHASLTSKLYGDDPSPAEPMIAARFNSDLGNPGCLTGSPFYLGLDGNHGNLIDLVTVLLHEFGHGLGFSTVTSGGTGAQLGWPALDLRPLRLRQHPRQDLGGDDRRRAGLLGRQSAPAGLERAGRHGRRAVGPGAWHAGGGRRGSRAR